MHADSVEGTGSVRSAAGPLWSLPIPPNLVKRDACISVDGKHVYVLTTTVSESTLKVRAPVTGGCVEQQSVCS